MIADKHIINKQFLFPNSPKNSPIVPKKSKNTSSEESMHKKEGPKSNFFLG